MSDQVEVSVVVPTRNRSALLARLVDCLSQPQGAAFELIAVDDSSDDDTRVVLHDLAEAAPFPMRVAWTERPSGSAAARNVGWRLAAAPIVAFTDDDCRPQPGWLGALVESFAHADVVQGRTLFDHAEAAGRGPFSQIVSVERWTGQFETSNVAYRASVLDAVGGFDEHFGGDSYGEDVDLGWRAVEHGASTAFAPDAVVMHDVKRSSPGQELLASIRAARRWRHIGRVLRDHPGYRPYRLHRDPFLAPTHPTTLLALAGMALFVVLPRGHAARPFALAAIAPWVRYRSIVEPRPGCRRKDLPVVLPAAFVVDAAEALTVACSGARYGVFVL